MVVFSRARFLSLLVCGVFLHSAVAVFASDEAPVGREAVSLLDDVAGYLARSRSAGEPVATAVKRLVNALLEERDEAVIERVLVVLIDMVQGGTHDGATDDDVLAWRQAVRTLAVLADRWALGQVERLCDEAILIVLGQSVQRGAHDGMGEHAIIAGCDAAGALRDLAERCPDGMVERLCDAAILTALGASVQRGARDGAAENVITAGGNATDALAFIAKRCPAELVERLCDEAMLTALGTSVQRGTRDGATKDMIIIGGNAAVAIGELASRRPDGIVERLCDEAMLTALGASVQRGARNGATENMIAAGSNAAGALRDLAERCPDGMVERLCDEAILTALGASAQCGARNGVSDNRVRAGGFATGALGWLAERCPDGMVERLCNEAILTALGASVQRGARDDATENMIAAGFNTAGALMDLAERCPDGMVERLCDEAILTALGASVQRGARDGAAENVIIAGGFAADALASIAKRCPDELVERLCDGAILTALSASVQRSARNGVSDKRVRAGGFATDALVSIAKRCPDELVERLCNEAVLTALGASVQRGARDDATENMIAAGSNAAAALRNLTARCPDGMVGRLCDAATLAALGVSVQRGARDAATENMIIAGGNAAGALRWLAGRCPDELVERLCNEAILTALGANVQRGARDDATENMIVAGGNAADALSHLAERCLDGMVERLCNRAILTALGASVQRGARDDATENLIIAGGNAAGALRWLAGRCPAEMIERLCDGATLAALGVSARRGARDGAAFASTFAGRESLNVLCKIAKRWSAGSAPTKAQLKVLASSSIEGSETRLAVLMSASRRWSTWLANVIVHDAEELLSEEISPSHINDLVCHVGSVKSWRSKLLMQVVAVFARKLPQEVLVKYFNGDVRSLCQSLIDDYRVWRGKVYVLERGRFEQEREERERLGQDRPKRSLIYSISKDMVDCIYSFLEHPSRGAECLAALSWLVQRAPEHPAVVRFAEREYAGPPGVLTRGIRSVSRFISSPVGHQLAAKRLGGDRARIADYIERLCAFQARDVTDALVGALALFQHIQAYGGTSINPVARGLLRQQCVHDGPYAGWSRELCALLRVVDEGVPMAPPAVELPPLEGFRGTVLWDQARDLARRLAPDNGAHAGAGRGAHEHDE